jgi:hypothetical protein
MNKFLTRLKRIEAAVGIEMSALVPYRCAVVLHYPDGTTTSDATEDELNALREHSDSMYPNIINIHFVGANHE